MVPCFPKNKMGRKRSSSHCTIHKKYFRVLIRINYRKLFQTQIPHILKENYVVSLLLDENKAFRLDGSHPSIIKENKTSASLLQHQDIVPTLLEMTGLSPMQTASGYSFVDSVYGKAARPFVRQIQMKNDKMQMDVYYQDVNTVIDMETKYESVQSTELPKDIFEDSKTILQSIQRTK